MISKRLSAVFSLNGRLNDVKKLNFRSKHFLSVNNHIDRCHPKQIQHLYTNKHRIDNVILRRSHVNKTTTKITEDYFAHHFMECSEAYSTALPLKVTLDQDLQAKEVEVMLQKSWISMSIPEILQNFEHLSVYAAKSLDSINKSEYNGILEVLTNKVPDFSDQEIHHLFSCLALWRIETTQNTYKNLLTILDKECLKRMQDWSLEEILLTNVQFFKLRMSRFVNFSWNSLRKLGAKSRKMTPANLVQFAFLIKVSRRIPIHMYEIEYRLEKYFDNYSTEELAIIAMAFIKYETLIKSDQLTSKILQKLITEIDTVNDISLKNLIQIIRFQPNPETQEQFYTLFKSLESQVSRFNIHTLTHIMEFLSKMSIFNEQLISKILEKCEKEIKDMKLLHIEKVMMSLHKFNCDPKTTPFYSTCYNELIDPERAELFEKSNRNTTFLINCVVPMVKQKFYPEKILKHVLDPDFIHKKYQSNLHKLDRSYLDIDFCVELDYPEYNGPRVKKEILNFLMKYFGALKPESKRYKPKMSLNATCLADLLRILTKMSNSEMLIHTDSVLPHAPKRHIILRRDPETKEFLSPKILENTPRGLIKYAPDDGKKWYAITIASNNLISRNDALKYTGILECEIRHLNNIGYLPIVIPSRRWLALTSDNEKKRYLENLLR